MDSETGLATESHDPEQKMRLKTTVREMAKKMKKRNPVYRDPYDGLEGLPPPYKSDAPDKAAAARDFQKLIVDRAVYNFSGISEFKEHWEEAKRRLGVKEAGETFDVFLRNNIKVIPLNPWAKPEDRSYMRTTGSFNPKTYDHILTLVKIAPTTSKPAIYDPIAKIVMPMKNFAAIIRAGMWSCIPIYPQPGKGLRLKRWETVSGVTAQFTVPYLVDATETDDADPMNMGTTEGIWTDETSEREVYELHR